MIFAATPILCVVFFAMIHFGHVACRLGQRFNMWDAIMLVWCVSYAVFALRFAEAAGVLTGGPGGPGINIAPIPVTLFVMVPTLFTALIASASWRSFHYVWVMLIAGGVAVWLTMSWGLLGLMLLGPIVWIALYAFVCSLMLRAINRRYSRLICRYCGYSLIDLPQSLPCPECGESR